MLNKILLIGNLVADPELRYTPAGTPVTTFRIAVNRKFRTPSGEVREDPLFVNIVTWNKNATNCAQFLKKGSQVFVDGRLSIRSYDKDNQRKWITEIVAGEVKFLGSRRVPEEIQEQEEKPEEIAEEIPPVELEEGEIP